MNIHNQKIPILNFNNYTASPQQISKFLDNFNCHAQLETVNHDLVYDDIDKLIQVGILIKENNGYIRIGSQLRDAYHKFHDINMKLKPLIKLKQFIITLTIASNDLRSWMARFTDKHQDKPLDLITADEIIQGGYYVSNLCSIINSIRSFLQQDILCKNSTSDKLIDKYSQFQHDYDKFNEEITTHHLYKVCSVIRNICSHGGQINHSIIRTQNGNYFYYNIMCDYHQLDTNSNMNLTGRKCLEKYYYHASVWYLEMLLQDKNLDNQQINEINMLLQLALNNKNINVSTLSKNNLNNYRNDNEIKLYHYNNCPKNSLMPCRHWFNVSSFLNDAYISYVNLYTELYTWMKQCDQNLIQHYSLTGNSLKHYLEQVGGTCTIIDFDLKSDNYF